MHPLQIRIVHQPRAAVGSGLEVEGAPRNQRGLVREPGQVDVRFAVELWHILSELDLQPDGQADEASLPLYAIEDKPGSQRLSPDRLKH